MISDADQAFLLARWQFAFTISFHIIFPAISIGLASYLAVLEGLWLRTKRTVYHDLFLFWSKIFAVGFAMGVVSGVVMSYEFGTNWSGFSTAAGAITGPLLAYEVMTAFFLEAGFLGIMLLGWNKVGPRAHYFATLMVAVGTLISTFWILASNSWMQTPQGFALVNGRFTVTDWYQVIFNPSFPYRLVHMTLAAFIVAACIVGACSAWHLVRGNNHKANRTSLSMAMWMLLAVVPIQMLVGDAHGLNTREHQPAKLAAMEGLWQTEKGGTALTLVGWPDMEREETLHAIKIPHLGSLILTHSWDGEIQGLKDFPATDRPNSTIVFWTFRVMVGMGLLLLAMALIGACLRRKGRIYEKRWFLWFVVAMAPSGLIALLTGWITTEAGRQPWVVYGLLRTRDAVSTIDAHQVGTSLLMFVIIYFSVFGTGIYYMLKLMHRGPSLSAPSTEAESMDTGLGRARFGHRPMSQPIEPIDE